MQGFSHRSTLGTETNALTQALDRRRAEGRPVLSLAESNPTSVGLAWPHAELAHALTHPGIAEYQPDPFGLLAVRGALSAHLASSGLEVPAERLMLTASTSEAYGFLFKLLCDAGDNVLVPSPSYPLFDVLASLEGVQLRPYQLAYDGEWHVDLASVRAALDARSRAILLVHPNNPTGSFLKRDELQELASLQLPLISDEVFAEYAFTADPRRAHSALEVSERALVFRLGGLSKSVALPQLKLAWTAIAGPGAAEACERLQHIADSYLSVATPVQLALPSLLRHGSAARERVAARTRRNLAQLTKACEHSTLDVLGVEGGWYGIVRVPALHTDEEWAISLLEREGVLVQPGFFYDLTRGTHLVLSLITEDAHFSEGVARLTQHVAREVG
ncbi:MAG: pyridoxal phosphate-dependent aminotransferase [Myxococcales bacterium]